MRRGLPVRAAASGEEHAEDEERQGPAHRPMLPQAA
jgi:hypothetical protein